LSADKGSIAIARADPAAPEIAALIGIHAARSQSLYPSESCHVYGPAEMAAEGVLLFVARVAGNAVAIGGLRPLGPAGGEIKSMHTLEAWRGRGIGARLMDRLMDDARARGWPALFLETGSDAGSAAARAVYARLGFVLCPPFGEYRPDPLSVFMTRAL
jgi:putative acetyltransferase